MENKVKSPSTRQLLQKLPNCPCLYRHTINNTYYGIKKHGGKRKEHSLQTDDRQIAERKLKAWINDLDKIDTEAEKTTLMQLLDKFTETRNGKSESTKTTEQGLINNLKEKWKNGLDIRVSRIRPTMLDAWLAGLEANLKNSSYNRYTLFIKQLFDMAVNDKIIADSPFYRLQKGWKRPEKPHRIVPTGEQFKAIVENIRGENQNAAAEESANFVQFLGLAGLGQGEASSLTWGDVDFKNARITVRRKKTKHLFYVPIYKHLKPLLKRLLGNCKSKPTPETRIFSISDAKKSLANACKRLEFPHFTQRSIRAHLIRRLWQADVDVKLISKWQGHNDGGRLILSTYTEVFGDNDAEYVKAELAKVK
jgi:integrase